MPPRKAPWEQVREEYVAGPDELTLAVLAAHYGVAVETVCRHAAAEKWAAQRVQHRHTVAIRGREKATTSEAEIRVRHIGIAKLMQAKAIARLRTLDPEKMDLSEVRHYLRDATEIERRAAGIPDEVRTDNEGTIRLLWPDARVTNGNGGGTPD